MLKGTHHLVRSIFFQAKTRSQIIPPISLSHITSLFPNRFSYKTLCGFPLGHVLVYNGIKYQVSPSLVQIVSYNETLLFCLFLTTCSSLKIMFFSSCCIKQLLSLFHILLYHFFTSFTSYVYKKFKFIYKTIFLILLQTFY